MLVLSSILSGQLLVRITSLNSDSVLCGLYASVMPEVRTALQEEMLAVAVLGHFTFE